MNLLYMYYDSVTYHDGMFAEFSESYFTPHHYTKYIFSEFVINVDVCQV